MEGGATPTGKVIVYTISHSIPGKAILLQPEETQALEMCLFFLL